MFVFLLKTRFFPDLSTGLLGARFGRTEVLLGGTTLLDNLDKAGLELLNGGNVVGEDTHLTSLGWEVDLDAVHGRASVTGRSKSQSGSVGTYTSWDLKMDYMIVN